MGSGRGIAYESMHVGAHSAADSSRKCFGFSLKQTVVIIVVAYALLTALFVGRHFTNPEKLLDSSEKFLTNVQGEKSNVLEIEEVGSNSLSNSSDLPLIFGAEDDSVKEDDLYYELRNSLYHSSLVFGLNYKEMLSTFKVFVYPVDSFSFKVLSAETEFDELEHTEDMFVYQLFQSDFVTLDPERAHLFFLPLSMRAVVENSEVGVTKAGKHLSKYVQQLRDGYQFWSRALGADHVIVSCTGAKEDGSRNVLELRKNAIQVACSPLADSQSFYPHKDVAMPMFQNTVRATADLEGERSILAYYSGPMDADSLYVSFDVAWDTDPMFAVEFDHVESDVHLKLMSKSKFCVILGPQDYGNIVTALRFGCVPVIVSDGRLYDLPFQDVLNWGQFVLILDRKNVKKMKELLVGFDEQQYVAMQYLGKEASKHLEWHNPPQDQDAFFMVLYDLWIRRHAIRYVRRGAVDDEL